MTARQLTEARDLQNASRGFLSQSERAAMQRCPRWVKTRHAQAFKRCPLLLQYQTLVGTLAIDANYEPAPGIKQRI